MDLLRLPRAGPSLTASVADVVDGIYGLSHRLRAAKDADVGLAFNTRPRLRVITSVQLRFGAVMAPDRPLARPAQVTLLDCAAHPLIVPSDDWLDQTMTQSLFPGGFGEFNVVARSGRASVLRTFVRAGLGIKFLPRGLRKRAQRPGLCTSS